MNKSYMKELAQLAGVNEEPVDKNAPCREDIYYTPEYTADGFISGDAFLRNIAFENKLRGKLEKTK